jgi:hypothetical protein
VGVGAVSEEEGGDVLLKVSFREVVKQGGIVFADLVITCAEPMEATGRQVADEGAVRPVYKGSVDREGRG